MCVGYASMCVCVCVLWPATPVHLKLFSCRQAHSARSRALHLVNLALNCLLGRLGSSVCVASLVCVCVCVCTDEAFTITCAHVNNHTRAIVRAFPARYAMRLNNISTYPLYTDTPSAA